MSKKGFTLLELLVVVIIIGILASMVGPQYSKAVEKSRWAEAVTNIGTLRGAVDRHWYETGTIEEDPSKLDVDNPNLQNDKLFTYAINDNGDGTTRVYDVTATRIGGTGYTMTWNQTSSVDGSMEYPSSY
ncbi:MAG: prepilin-type N-terminal cleavage/methylation domain-containing protein [Candidatus Omnitrophota bacterium]